jgi:cytochrome c5
MEKMMPPFADSLSDQERRDLAAAVMALRADPERLVRGRESYEQACAACHAAGREGAPAFGAGPGTWSERARSLAPGKSAEELRALATSGSHAAAPLAISNADLGHAVDFLQSAAYVPLDTAAISPGATVRGRVVHGVTGDGVPAATVAGRTRIYGLPGSVVTATTGADGAFELPDVLHGPKVSLSISTTYQTVDYGAVVTPSLEVSRVVPTEISVYETTSQAPLVAENVSVLLSPDPRESVIRAVELWTISNLGNATAVAQPGAPPIVRFWVPEGATDVQLSDRLVGLTAEEDPAGPGGLALRGPIRPGTNRLSFEYAVPYETADLEWWVRPALDAGDVRLAMLAEGVGLAEGSNQSTTSMIGDTAVSGPALGRVTAGDERRIAVTGLPVPAILAAARTAERDAWFGRAALVLATCGVIGALSYGRWGALRATRRRRRTLEARRSRILEELSALGHDAGDETTARLRRGELVEEAIRTERMLAALDDEQEVT